MSGIPSNLARILDLKKKLAVIEDHRARLQDQLFACIEVLLQENLKYDELAEPQEPVLKRVSKDWRKILQRLAQYERFRARDIITVSRKLHKEDQLPRVQTAGSARFQLAALEKKGVLKRLGGGNYRLSDRVKSELYLVVEEVLGPELPALVPISGG